MRLHRCASSSILILAFVLFSPFIATAQDGASRSYEFGVRLGPMLPSRILGVREIINGWSLLGAIPTNKGVFELSTFAGANSGIVYRSGAVSYRLDLSYEFISAHFLLGLHGDSYTSPRKDQSFVGGWHYGGGITQQIAGPLHFRGDFTYRFGPGNSVIVLLGFIYRFDSLGT